VLSLSYIMLVVKGGYQTMKTMLVGALVALLSVGAQAREYISIVGSSTVFPFSTAVAENLGKDSRFKTPVVESTGSGGGLKIFCSGLGTTYPDITNASRAIKQKEIDDCKKNGVTPVEYLAGYDGIVIANSKDGTLLTVTLQQLYLAMAYQIPSDNGWIENPYTRWNEIDSSLPNLEIAMMIPPTTSGTRDALVELVMHQTCKKQYGLSKKEYKKLCTPVRTDGYVVEMTENDNLIVQKLGDDKNRYGVFGFSFLDQNSDVVQGAIVDGVNPTFETIADSSYPISRALYYYVKEEHVGLVPGIEEYIAKFKQLSAPGGMLEDLGLITVE